LNHAYFSVLALTQLGSTLVGMQYLQIAVLALIQGAAELLPVSSSAHVIVAEKLMGLDPGTPQMMFVLVMLHTGTMFAVLTYFLPRWRAIVRPAEPSALTGRRFAGLVILATAITGVLGLALKWLIEKVVMVRIMGPEQVEIEHLSRDLRLVAAALFAAGVVIIAAGTARIKENAAALHGRSAALIGIVQALCLPFRGFSRSGATISAGMFCNMPRSLAEDFSFALAVALTPAVVVYELYRLLKASDLSASTDLLQVLLPGLVGMACSFVSGLVALRLLSRVLEEGGWKYFGYYCVIASAAVLAFALSGY
jgi:undecaprenyl-diphosphatase